MGCSCLGDGSVTLRQPVSFSNSSNGHCSPVAVALRSRLHSSKTRTAQKLLRVVVYTTLSRALGVLQGIYRASISNICSAVAGTAYVVCAEPFILWLPRLQSCVTPNCTEHNHSLDSYARNFLSTLLDCARQCFPQHSSSPRRLVCWNDTSCSKLKQTTNFWYRLWEDAGHPSSGVLFQIKKNTKTRYKYEIRRLKRRQNVLLQDKFASLFASKKKDDFWSQIRQLNRSCPSPASSVDNVSGDVNIANLFASKFANVLNSNSSSSRDSHHSSIQSSIESWHLRDVHFSDKEVLEARSLLKSKKTDSDGVSSDHLKLASSAIAKPLAIFLTSVVRHGYLPQCLSDCVLIPIPRIRLAV